MSTRDVLPVSVPQCMDLCSNGSSAGKARKHNLRQRKVFLPPHSRSWRQRRPRPANQSGFLESTKNEEALICREGKGIRNRKQTETKKYMKGISFRFLGIAFFWLVLHEVGWESITEREQAGFVEKKKPDPLSRRYSIHFER